MMLLVGSVVGHFTGGGVEFLDELPPQLPVPDPHFEETLDDDLKLLVLLGPHELPLPDPHLDDVLELTTLLGRHPLPEHLDEALCDLLECLWPFKFLYDDDLPLEVLPLMLPPFPMPLEELLTSQSSSSLLAWL